MRTVPFTSERKYAVGIDFGHGECSAAFCEIGWGRSSSMLDDPSDINLCGNKKTIPSAYSVLPDGRMLIGNTAVNNVKSAKQFKISFKKRPTEMNPEERLLYERYLGLVHNYIINKTTIPLSPDNKDHVVFLSCPSGWNIEDREIFNESALSAGIPVAGIWAESRAGLFSNIESQTEDVRKLMRQGCILIDLGSSTIDFSYLNESLDTPIMDSGIQDGAQTLDMMLYYYILSLPGNEMAKELVEREDMKWLKDRLVYSCRQSKEKFFSMEDNSPLSINFDFGDLFFEEKDLACACFRCYSHSGGSYEEIMNLFFGGLSSVGLAVSPDEQFACVDWDAVNHGYFSVLSRRLKSFVEQHVKRMPVKVILLSGGASNMFYGESGKKLFREHILQETFPSMSVSIAFDGMPSTSVSRGICSLGRAYARYTGCEGYDGLNAKMEKTLNYHLSVIQLIGSQKVLDIDEGQNKLYRGLFKKKDTTPQSEPQEKLSEKHPFSESARNFIYALANTDTIHLGTYKRDSLKGLPLLLEAVRPGFRMPQEITEGLSNEYESFLSEVVGGGMSVREAVAKSIAERVMPLAREYVNQFEGDTLQEFRDGLAKAVEDSYENILTSAQNAVQGIIRENLEIECNYAVNLISLYTATIQKDFNLDPKEVSAIIKLPSVQEVTDDLKISQTVIADIASALLNFAMVIIWGIVNTILFGLPLAVTYIIYGIKEKDWSFESYTEWLVDNFMSIDLSKLKLYRGGRNSVKKQFEKNYDKSKQEMKNNICRILDEKQIDQIFCNAFKTVAEDCKDRYIKVVNNIFC